MQSVRTFIAEGHASRPLQNVTRIVGLSSCGKRNSDSRAARAIARMQRAEPLCEPAPSEIHEYRQASLERAHSSARNAPHALLDGSMAHLPLQSVSVVPRRRLRPPPSPAAEPQRQQPTSGGRRPRREGGAQRRRPAVQSHARRRRPSPVHAPTPPVCAGDALSACSGRSQPEGDVVATARRWEPRRRRFQAHLAATAAVGDGDGTRVRRQRQIERQGRPPRRLRQMPVHFAAIAAEAAAASTATAKAAEAGAGRRRPL